MTSTRGNAADAASRSAGVKCENFSGAGESTTPAAKAMRRLSFIESPLELRSVEFGRLETKSCLLVSLQAASSIRASE